MTDYTTAAAVRAQPGMNSVDDDAVLGALITAASRAIDGFCNRPDGFVAIDTATARVFAGSGKAWQWIDETVAITLVEVKASLTDTTYTSWTTSDWTAFSGDPARPNFNGTPYTGLLINPAGSYGIFTQGVSRDGATPTVRVTGRWGYAETVPAPVAQACITLAARWYKRGQSFWSDVLGNSDTGQMYYRKAIDPDVQMMLKWGRMMRPGIG